MNLMQNVPNIQESEVTINEDILTFVYIICSWYLLLLL